MRDGHQWIHFDATFPLRFGHDLQERFGPVGQLLFIQFLCACKRSYPQGQINYRSEEEARILFAAPYPFIHSNGQEWTLEQFWKWCGTRKVTRTRARGGRTYVTATRWDVWEDDRNSKQRERRRRSRAESVRVATHGRGEVGVGRLEVGGVRGEGGAGGTGEPAIGPAAQKLLNHLEEVKTRQPETHNGDRP